MLLLKLLSA